MAWLNQDQSSGNDISEILQPRRQPPPGQKFQSVARIQPMVPEVSMFQPSVVQMVDSEQPELMIKPLTQQPMGELVNKGNQEVSGPKESPLPVAVPDINPTSEFSKMFLDNSLSVLSVPPSKSSPELWDHRQQELPEDVYKVLKWQNEQLTMLQDQVKQLLSSKDGFPLKEMSEMSTQTSAPSSPIKRPCLDAVDDVSILRINENHEEVLHEARPPTISPLSISESDRIVCQDLCPPENINAIIQDFSDNCKVSSEGAGGGVERGEPSIFGKLREMGVSFINPSDIRQSGSRLGEVSTWHPVAAEPSFVSTTESTSDYSLMLNSAALKYLDDEQLTHVAERNSGSSLSR